MGREYQRVGTLKQDNVGTGMCKDLFGAQLLCKVMGLTEQMLIKKIPPFKQILISFIESFVNVWVLA